MRFKMRFASMVVSACALSACGSPYYTAAPIEAWVVDAETGKPIEGAVVTANWQLVGFTLESGGSRLGQLEVMETVTDKDGRFYFPGFTKLNFSLGELRNDDPQILIFKSGYKFLGGSNEHASKGPPGAHRSASISGKTLKMARGDADIKKYATDLGFLTTGLTNIWNSGDAGKIPRMLHALACERRRLVAVDPGTPLSVLGATGRETDCETR